MKSDDKKTIHDVTKIYPDFVRVVRFKISFDVQLGAKPKKTRDKGLIPRFLRDREDDRAVRHAKTTIHDIVLCNSFDHFVTFTFDPKKVKSRHDVGYLKIRMHRWLEYQRKSHGRFQYLIVAETHKDGAIHFHALFAGYKGPLKDSGVKHEGRPVYNLASWRYGFSTAKIIDQTPESRQKVAGYVTKYISKEMVTFPGKKRYWVSQGLKRPAKIHNDYFANSSRTIYWTT